MCEIIVDYKCKNCSYPKFKHKAKTFECRRKGTSRNFPSFEKEIFYEANLSKPIYAEFLL